ncbi:hypothetical protein [Corynebacterium stationis]|uniref:hypothetical protein n=1 Tax=Corynebacterium stationis TaxID=1705 RepID=UPI0028ADEBDD|nr:hypothetical protein [Corynebacterium stationis]
MSDKALSFIKSELEHLWYDLCAAERSSRAYDPDIPSMAMENIMERIKGATAIVGPINWMHVSTRFISSGRYEHWAKYMGIEYEFPTDEEFSGGEVI